MSGTVQGGTVIEGAPGSRLGAAFAPVGDVDGDGIGDFAVGAPGAGEVAILFGRGYGLGGRIDAVSLASGEGLLIGGGQGGGALGAAVAGADLTGDGRPDLVLGEPDAAAPPGEKGEGIVRILDGRDLLSGVRADDAALSYAGEAVRTHVGQAVALGDLDGDGTGDAAFGVPGHSPGLDFGAGAVAIAWGGPELALPASLSDAGGAGSVVLGISALDGAGGALAAGDATGDGVADLLVGAPEQLRSGPLVGGDRPGAAHLVPGGARWDPIRLGGGESVAFVGAVSGDLAGSAVAMPGDVNGDGIGDILIGAPAAAGGRGVAYLVWGRTGDWPASLDLGTLAPADGVTIVGRPGARLGNALAASDLDDDGRLDLILAAPGTDAVEIVFGPEDGWPVRLELDDPSRTGVLRLDGPPGTGSAVAAAGDVDANGFADLLIGAAFSDRAYLVGGGALTLALLDGADGTRDGRASLEGVAEIALDGNAAVVDRPGAGGRIAGSDGADLLLGGDGGDLLAGGAGLDSLAGGGGDDAVSGGAGADDATGGPGADRLDGGPGNDALDAGDGDDIATGGDGNDEVSGGAGRDVLSGGPGADMLVGGPGDDRLAGGPGADILLGGAGDDDILGGGGDDVIDAGPGRDRLEGGPGADAFVFREGDGMARVADFAPGLDRLDFSRHAGVAGPGDLAISAAFGGTLILDGTGGEVVLDHIAPDALGPAAFLF